MRMNISAWAIRNPVPSLVLFMVLMTLGLTTFANMPVKRFPNIDIPVVTVLITQPGASPSELETQVTKKVEDAVAGITGVKHIISNVVEGASTTTLEFNLGNPVDRATNDVKDAIDRLRSDLPSTIEDPVVQRLDIAGLPILTYSARAPSMTPQELSWLVDDTIVRELQGLKGIAQVARIGGVTREIRVALDSEKLLALGINFARDAQRNFTFAARTQLNGDPLFGARAQAGTDIVAVNDNVLAGIIPAPNENMHMGVVGIPVIDRDPI